MQNRQSSLALINSPECARRVALRILLSVVAKSVSLSSELEKHVESLPLKERGLCKELCFGVMREYFVLETIYHKLLAKPLATKHLDIKLLLFIGFYQLKWLRIPDFAAINETVKLCNGLKKPWARALVNAVLRKFQKTADNYQYKITQTHPLWLIDRIKETWPEKWQDILTANQSRAPMIVRVNSLTTVLSATKIPFYDSAFKLDKPQNIENLPGFAEGLISVQDSSAQMAAVFIDLQAGFKVLDACAAPGGKTTHMLELEDGINLIALDNSQARLQKVKQNLVRIGKQAQLIHADAASQDWWDGVLFDRILLDAPCSGSGVIRRNPDIKLVRSEKDIIKLMATQAKILANCWPMLKSGGVLLYVTCSIFAEENDKQIGHFLSKTADALTLKLSHPEALTTDFGVQFLPTIGGGDGLYYAKLQKG